MALTYMELFAGGGGLSLGLEAAGWECLGHAEIEPQARAVLRHGWPTAPLHGDVATLTGETLISAAHGERPLLLSGGFPCQDVSVAGKRSGMAEGSGTRSSLFFEAMRIWEELGSPYILVENVLGLFSSNHGRDFAAVLSALVGAAVAVPADGWQSAGVAAGPTGVAAWRVLDCQFFGPPQRRRRVFVLGARAGGVDPAEVLAVGEGLCRDFAAGSETGEDAPGDARDRARAAEEAGGRDVRAVGHTGRGVLGWDAECNPAEQVMGPLDTGSKSGSGHVPGVMALNISNGVPSLDPVMGTLDTDRASSTAIGAQTRGVVLGFHLTQDPISASVLPALDSSSGGMGAVAFQPGNLVRRAGAEPSERSFPTLGSEMTGDQHPHVVSFAQNQRGELRTSPVASQLTTGGGKPGEGYPAILTFDARGNGDGQTVNTLAGDHQNRVTDYTALVFKPSHFTRGKDGAPRTTAMPLTADADRGDQEQVVVAPVIAAGAHPGGANGQDAPRIAHAILMASGQANAEIVEDRSPTLNTNHDGAPIAFQGVGIPRRLMPIETERLMGWPEVRKSVTVRVCVADQAKSRADADAKSHRLPESVGSVASAAIIGCASSAEPRSLESGPRGACAALPHVEIDAETGHATIASGPSGSKSSVSIAAKPSECARLVRAALTARASAAWPDIVAVEVPLGREESPPNTTDFTDQKSGSLSAGSCGDATSATADGALNDPLAERFTTSEVGASFPVSGLPLITLCSSVARAIHGCTPGATPNGDSFDFSLTVKHGWTAIGVDETGSRYALSDTARYRLCGNGVASPVAAWIGWRLATLLRLTHGT